MWGSAAMADGRSQAQRVDVPSAVVHVVDDEEEICWGIATLLMSAGFTAETHPSSLAFLDALQTLGGDGVGCVLTDVRMPEPDGLELLGRLRAGGFGRPVIVMTAHGDVSLAVRAMKAGAFDFVEKPFGDDALLAVVEAALGAPTGVGPRAAAPGAAISAGRGAGAHPRSIQAASRIAALSPRERQVLELAMEGKSSKVIAHELGISMRTVEVHRMRLMTRLDVGSLAEAVRLAVWAELADHGAGSSPMA